MSLENDLKKKTILANQKLAKNGIRICWGGDFHTPGNIFERGAQNVLEGLPFIFPICLNNGYYNEGQLENLARGVLAFGNKVHVFLTDGPSIHNYRALGYSQEYAVKKTRLERNWLLNRLTRSLYAIGAEAEQNFSVFNWNDIYAHPIWQNENKQLHELYVSVPTMHQEINEATRNVLAQRKKLLCKLKDDVPPASLSEEEIQQAKNYTLDEVTFVLVCDRLLGNKGFCYLYKESWPVLEKLGDGAFGEKRYNSVGFLGFHVLPSAASTNNAVIVSKRELAKLSAAQQASNPHRPDNAPKATIENVELCYPSA